MYVLKISPKAFIKQDEEIIIVSDPNKATKFEKIGDAMRVAAQINEDLETNIVHVFSL